MPIGYECQMCQTFRRTQALEWFFCQWDFAANGEFSWFIDLITNELKKQSAVDMIVGRTNPINRGKKVDCFVELFLLHETIAHASRLGDIAILIHAKRTH